MNYSERSKEYTRLYQLEIDTREKIEEKIHMREKQIKRLKKKLERAWNITPSWTEFLLRPLLNEIKALLPQVEWEEDDRLIPMGLMSRVSIFGKYKKQTIYLPFIPADLRNEGEIMFEADKQKEFYPEGSIGKLNGMGKDKFVIESAEQVVNYLKDKYEILK